MTDTDNLESLNRDEVKATYDAGILAGTIGLGTLIVIAMLGVIFAGAAIIESGSALHP